MVAVGYDKIRKIMAISDDVEPHIKELIRVSDETNCPYKMIRDGNLDSDVAKEVFTHVTRILYKEGLLNRIGLSLEDDMALNTIWYAFGYWGGKTVNKFGDDICLCNEKCYQRP